MTAGFGLYFLLTAPTSDTVEGRWWASEMFRCGRWNSSPAYFVGRKAGVELTDPLWLRKWSWPLEKTNDHYLDTAR